MQTLMQRSRLRSGHLVHYEYMALAQNTSVLREAMLLFLEPVNNNKIVPRRVCIHFFEAAFKQCFLFRLSSRNVLYWRAPRRRAICLLEVRWTSSRWWWCGSRDNEKGGSEKGGTWLFTLLDVFVSSLRRGHANLLRIVPILTDDPRRKSTCKKGEQQKHTNKERATHRELETSLPPFFTTREHRRSTGNAHLLVQQISFRVWGTSST